MTATTPDQLTERVLAAYRADDPVLLRFRGHARRLADLVRPIRPYSANAVSFVSTDGGDNRLSELTPREREVLELIAEGRSNAAVGQALVISASAVEKHISNIFWKLDLPASDADHRRVLAVLAYLNG